MDTMSRTQEGIEGRTRQWLESSFDRKLASRSGTDFVYGRDGQPQNMSADHFQLLVRKLKIFSWFDRFRFSNFIDIGSGFDCFPDLVRARYGVPAYYSDFAHAMNLPFGDNGRLDSAVTLNISRLPFEDAAFDLVLCSEVLEHLVHPVEAIAELLRITRKYLVMTSLEALKWGRLDRFFSQHRVDIRRPHIERNFLLIDEFEALFGRDQCFENLFSFHDLPENPMLPPSQRDAYNYASLRSREALGDALQRAVSYRGFLSGAAGILLVKTMPGEEVLPASDITGLTRWIIEQSAQTERQTLARLSAMANGEVSSPGEHHPVSAGLLGIVRCPDCKERLEPTNAGLRCIACRAEFPVEYGVPILYPQVLPQGAVHEEECLTRICGADPERRKIVGSLMNRLKRNNKRPSFLRRVMWALETHMIGLIVPALDVSSQHCRRVYARRQADCHTNSV